MFSCLSRKWITISFAALAISTLPVVAQEVRQDDRAFDVPAGAVSMQDFNACKRDAYDYGVMGTFRRLYILSCLDTEATASTKQAVLD